MRLEAVIVLTVVILVAAVIEWLQRRTDSPIMRRRVNDASDAYLKSQGTPLDAARRSVRSFVTRLGG
jgi:hypothetical protein